MTDTFRKNYHVLTDTAKQLVFDMKSKAEELEKLFDLMNNREMSLAKTNLEQAMMWATKAVVLQDEDQMQQECSTE